MAARERLPLLGILLGVLLAVPAMPSAAEASKYIVVLDIEGERTPRLQKTIARMVKSAHNVMAGSVYLNASRRLRAQKLTPTNVKRVCEYLKADGVIDGTLVKQSGRYKFTLRLRSGVTGAITKKIPMLINQPGLSSNMAQQLEQKLLVAIDSLPRAGGKNGRAKERIADVPQDDFEDDFEDQAEPPRRMTRAERRQAARERVRERREAERAARERAAEEKAERERRAREEGERRAELRAERRRKARERIEARRRARDDRRDRERDRDEEEFEEELGGGDAGFEDEPAEEDDFADEDDEEPPRAAMRDVAEDDESPLPKASASVSAEAADESKATDVRTTPVLINAGASFIGRKLSFNHGGAAEDAPNGYQGKPVPGGFINGEIYPLAFGGKEGVTANIGLSFVADRALGLKSQVADGMGGTANLATRQSKYGAGLRYRHNLSSMTVYAGVGYNKLSFVIDKANAPEGVIVDVPNVAYTYVDPGLGARIPFGKFALLVEAKFMAVLSAGEVQRPEEYGAATITGFDADGGVEYRITDHILARAGVHASMLGFAFKGNGAMLDRNGDGTNDVGGAADRYLGGYVTAGYAF